MKTKHQLVADEAQEKQIGEIEEEGVYVAEK